jgi:hypothetical protein
MEALPPAQASRAAAAGFSGYRVFAIVGIVSNVMLILLHVIGSFAMSALMTPYVLFLLSIYWSIAAWNIVLLSGRWQKSRKGAIAANLVVLVALQLLVMIVNVDINARVGLGMTALVGTVSSIALVVCTRDSWWALRIERSRLEEMKRIADLRKDLNLPEQRTESTDERV